MIKKFSILMIDFYQILVSPFLKVITGSNRFCRFEETCSDYTKRAISEKGLLVGLRLGLSRFLKCQPFYSGSLKKEAGF